LHTLLGERNYTALFSNTAKAHALGTPRDRVVLDYDGGVDERHATVITSHLRHGREANYERHDDCV